MRTRLQQLIEKENISPARFAEIVGVQRSSVSHILSGRNNPGLDFIQKILAAFPKVSSGWLITGEGGIYRQVAIQEPSKIQLNTQTAVLGDLFSTLKDEGPAVYETTTTKAQTAANTSAATEKSIPIIEVNNDVKPVSISASDNKEVERIVVFYTDHTFKEYKPE
jgi:transcriptional regulator with XRE-family HTH domain